MSANVQRCAIALAVALPLFLICCTFCVGGLAKNEWPGDVGHYRDLGQRVVDGDVPYHDFYVEYPPGALPAFVVPALISETHYVRTFKWLMALVGSLTLVAAAVLLCGLGADTIRLATGLGAIAVAPLLLGHVYLNRYDPWAALLVSLGLLLLAVRRAQPAFAFLSLAIAAKVYAVAALPIAAIRVWRAEGKRRLFQAGLTFVLVLAVVVLPFAVVAFGGLGFSFYTQSTRPLQVESLGASILLAADSVGIYHTHLIGGKANSIDLDGVLPSIVGVLTSLVVIAAVLTVAWTYIRGSESRERLITAFAAAIVGYLVFFKVFSPQYMTWLIPLVPLVAGRRGRVATVLFLGALLLTQIEIYGFDSVHGIPDTHVVYGNPHPWAPWVLLGRNLLLVAVFFVLLSKLRSDRVSHALPVPRGPAARATQRVAQG